MRSKSDWSLQSNAASSAFILAGALFPALPSEMLGEEKPLHVRSHFSLSLSICCFTCGDSILSEGGFQCTEDVPAVFAGSRLCCQSPAQTQLCSQPISQPIARQLQLLRNLCKGRRLAMSDFSCDVFVGSPGGCRQPSQTLTCSSDLHKPHHFPLGHLQIGSADLQNQRAGFDSSTIICWLISTNSLKGHL